jgi:urease accessory protein
MLQLRGTIDAGTLNGNREHSAVTLTLPFEERRKSRLLTRLDDGREAAVVLPRGTVLADGVCLLDDQANVVVTIKAATENLSVAYAQDRHQMLRAAYHLGNRHIPVQIGHDWLAYQHDHVLDDLARSLGLVVKVEERPFEPEAGGYGQSHGHPHGADHPHHEH